MGFGKALAPVLVSRETVHRHSSASSEAPSPERAALCVLLDFRTLPLSERARLGSRTHFTRLGRARGLFNGASLLILLLFEKGMEVAHLEPAHARHVLSTMCEVTSKTKFREWLARRRVKRYIDRGFYVWRFESGRDESREALE